MQETSRYAVGIDIGTTKVRCVVGHIDATTGSPTIVGVGESINKGMRKGVIADLTGPAHAIDEALGEAERMGGYQVNSAVLSINGSHILSTKADGMIAVGSMDHEINHSDLARIEEVATLGKIPANREIIEVVPHSYRLDGQDNIKDPLGMTGTRLEVIANVVSVLVPYYNNLQKSAEMVKVAPNGIVPAVMGAAKSVLSEQQIENGVAVVDIGGSTTSVAVFEEGDIQYVGVIPMGGINITNDLAIGLKTDPEIAEKVKLQHATIMDRENKDVVTIKHEKENHEFETSDIDEIVEARLEEIFNAVQKELKKAGRAGRLPSGVVLTGGTAKIKGITRYAREKLGVAARIGKVSGYGGVAEGIEDPQYATVVGLMLIDAQNSRVGQTIASSYKSGGKSMIKSAGGIISKIFDKFKV